MVDIDLICEHIYTYIPDFKYLESLKFQENYTLRNLVPHQTSNKKLKEENNIQAAFSTNCTTWIRSL